MQDWGVFWHCRQAPLVLLTTLSSYPQYIFLDFNDFSKLGYLLPSVENLHMVSLLFYRLSPPCLNSLTSFRPIERYKQCHIEYPKVGKYCTFYSTTFIWQLWLLVTLQITCRSGAKAARFSIHLFYQQSHWFWPSELDRSITINGCLIYFYLHFWYKSTFITREWDFHLYQSSILTRHLYFYSSRTFWLVAYIRSCVSQWWVHSEYTHQCQRPLFSGFQPQWHKIGNVWEDAEGNKKKKRCKKKGKKRKRPLRADCISFLWHKSKQRKHCPAARFGRNSPRWKASFLSQRVHPDLQLDSRQQIMAETQLSGKGGCSLHYDWQVVVFPFNSGWITENLRRGL